jgi:hypothetical protein
MDDYDRLHHRLQLPIKQIRLLSLYGKNTKEYFELSTVISVDPKDSTVDPRFVLIDVLHPYVRDSISYPDI